MSIVEEAKNKIKEWLFTVALKKAVISAAKLIVSWAIAHGIKISIPVGGITIDTTSEAAMIVAINSGLTILRNFIKIKFPNTFGWL